MNTLTTHNIVRFESREEILDLEGFDIDCSVTLDNFERIIGWFHFKEKEKCQVLKTHKNCNHLYNWGWVVGIKGDKKAMIGCDCADSKFDASEQFQLDSSRGRYAMDRDPLIKRLRFYWREMENMRQWLDVDTQRIRLFEDQLRDIGNCLPRSIKAKCVDMEKTRNRNVIVELKYTEEDENGREHIDWVAVNTGVLQSSHLWLPGFFDTYRKRLYSTRSALLESQHYNDDTNNRQLIKWLKALDDYKPLIDQLDGFEAALSKFCSLENMVTLYFMTRSQEFRANIARAHFLNRNEIPTNDKCRALAEQIEALVTARTEGKEFRAAA